jgi:hypothetical protein
LKAFALALLLVNASCSLGPSASQKAEAGRISRAIDVLRAAPNSAKWRLFSALQQAACETPDLCELKRSCEAGYAQHLAGLDAMAQAKLQLKDGGKSEEINRSLDTARRALGEAALEIAQCADAQGAAHRKYKF